MSQMERNLLALLQIAGFINLLVGFLMSSYSMDGMRNNWHTTMQFLRWGEVRELRRSSTQAWSWKTRLLVHLFITLYVF